MGDLERADRIAARRGRVIAIYRHPFAVAAAPAVFHANPRPARIRRLGRADLDGRAPEPAQIAVLYGNRRVAGSHRRIRVEEDASCRFARLGRLQIQILKLESALIVTEKQRITRGIDCRPAVAVRADDDRLRIAAVAGELKEAGERLPSAEIDRVSRCPNAAVQRRRRAEGTVGGSRVGIVAVAVHIKSRGHSRAHRPEQREGERERQTEMRKSAHHHQVR